MFDFGKEIRMFLTGDMIAAKRLINQVKKIIEQKNVGNKRIVVGVDEWVLETCMQILNSDLTSDELKDIPIIEAIYTAFMGPLNLDEEIKTDIGNVILAISRVAVYKANYQNKYKFEQFEKMGRNNKDIESDFIAYGDKRDEYLNNIENAFNKHEIAATLPRNFYDLYSHCLFIKCLSQYSQIYMTYLELAQQSPLIHVDAQFNKRLQLIKDLNKFLAINALLSSKNEDGSCPELDKLVDDYKLHHYHLQDPSILSLDAKTIVDLVKEVYEKNKQLFLRSEDGKVFCNCFTQIDRLQQSIAKDGVALPKIPVEQVDQESINKYQHEVFCQKKLNKLSLLLAKYSSYLIDKYQINDIEEALSNPDSVAKKKFHLVFNILYKANEKGVLPSTALENIKGILTNENIKLLSQHQSGQEKGFFYSLLKFLSVGIAEYCYSYGIFGSEGGKLIRKISNDVMDLPGLENENSEKIRSRL